MEVNQRLKQAEQELGEERELRRREKEEKQKQEEEHRKGATMVETIPIQVEGQASE